MKNLFKKQSSFLSGRAYGVIVGDEESDTDPVTSRVPKGYVLVLSLFIVYINYLSKNVNSKVCLFADNIAKYLNMTVQYSNRTRTNCLCGSLTRAWSLTPLSATWCR